MAASPAAFVDAAPTTATTFVARRSACEAARGRLRLRLPLTPRTARTARPRAHPRPTCTQQVDWKRVQLRATEAVSGARTWLASPPGQAALWGALLWLLLTGRAGWLFDSFLFLLFFFSVVPIVGIFVLRWWLNRQVVSGSCPACGAAVTGLRGRPIQCFACGHISYGEAAPPGGGGSARAASRTSADPASATIDIEAKRVD